MSHLNSAISLISPFIAYQDSSFGYNTSSTKKKDANESGFAVPCHRRGFGLIGTTKILGRIGGNRMMRMNLRIPKYEKTILEWFSYLIMTYIHWKLGLGGEIPSSFDNYFYLTAYIIIRHCLSFSPSTVSSRCFRVNQMGFLLKLYS